MNMSSVLRRMTTILVAICLIATMSLSVFASVKDDDGFIEVDSPNDGTVFYQGEKLHYEFTSYDTWKYLYTQPYVFIRKESNHEFYYTQEKGFVEVDGYNTYSGSYNTKNLPIGEYTFSVMHFAYEHVGDYDFYDVDNNPIAVVNFKVKKLLPPNSLKAAAGKKKVSLSFKKATGAQKYEIYRSTSKTKGYKKLQQ